MEDEPVEDARPLDPWGVTPAVRRRAFAAIGHKWTFRLIETTCVRGGPRHSTAIGGHAQNAGLTV